MDSRSATDGPGVLDCEELPEFEDWVIGVVKDGDDGLVILGPGPGPEELGLEAGVPSAPLERVGDESEA